MVTDLKPRRQRKGKEPKDNPTQDREDKEPKGDMAQTHTPDQNPARNYISEPTTPNGFNRFRNSLSVDFIDPLFAVAIGLGFEYGLLQEVWMKQWKWPQGDERFNLGVFLLAFLTISQSWAAYHVSIKDKPIKGNNLRFALDIVLVSFYIIMIVSYKNFLAVLCMLAVIHFFYFCWDLLKIKEYPEKYKDTDKDKVTRFRDKYARELVSLQWFIIFSCLPFWQRQAGNKGYILASAIAGAVLHRIDKNHHFFSKLWDKFCSWAIARDPLS